MQVWKPIAPFDVRSAPDPNAKTNRIADRDQVTRLRMIGASTDGIDGPWVKVRVYPGGVQPPFEGWARVAWLEVVPIPEAIDLVLFTAACVDAAIGKTSAHYLLALADLESGIKNVNSTGSSAFGPFQFLEPTWTDYVHANLAAALTDIDILDPLVQPIVAAEVATTGAQTIGAAIARKPTYAEIYFAHIFGRSGGAAILKQDPATSIRVALSAVYADAGRVTQIMDKNASLLQANGTDLTVRGVIDEVGRRLDNGFGRAETLIDAYLQANPNPAATDIQPPAPVQANGQNKAAPWMARAESEIGVTEAAGSRSNPRIEAYFRATTLGTQTDEVSWCGAFVSWCLANCGDPAVVRQSIRSARAADWLGFGQEDLNPSVGALAVLRPLVAGSSGHVGFVTKLDATSFTLLAGNQGKPNRVCERVFKRAALRQHGFRKPV